MEELKICYRNPGRWDIYDKNKRLCKIRGVSGNFLVLNDYGDIMEKTGFETVVDAMTYILETLIKE